MTTEDDETQDESDFDNWCETRPDGTIAVSLEYPVKLGKKMELTDLTVRRPRAGDIARASRAEDDMAQSITLAASLTGHDTKAVEMLDIADFERVMKAVEMQGDTGKARRAG